MPPSLQDAVASGDVALATTLVDASLTSNGGAHASRNMAVMDRAGDMMGRTALHIASESGHGVMVEWLLTQCQAEANARDSQGARPLHYAAEGNKVDAIDVLLRNGAKVSMADDQGELPMHWACARGAVGTCESLLREGVSPTVPTKTGWTPIHLAALNGRNELLSLLIARLHKTRGDTELRAALNAPLPENGRTPLHLAARNAQLGAIEVLANKGADPEAIDADGLRPADLTLNAGVRTLLGARTVGGGVGVGGKKVAATVTALSAVARFKKGGGVGKGNASAVTKNVVTAAASNGPPSPVPPPPNAPRSGAPRAHGAGLATVTRGMDALKVEEEIDFQERVREELRVSREKEKAFGPLGGASTSERKANGANKEFLSKYGLDNKKDLFAP